jgi:hypothetical protein
MTIKKIVQAMTIATTVACAAAQAAPIMPDFSGAPAGWSTDRYAPANFSDIGSYQGRGNVLAIGISGADSLANRPSAYQSGFYNTQGKGHAMSGGAGSVLSADVYVPAVWGDASNSHVRTDMWGVMSNASNAVTDYTIIGFTNYGGDARLRVWDSDVNGGWVDVLSLASFNDWMSLSIDFTGSSYVYSVNGNAVYTDNTIGGSTQFSSVLMQAYNFGDASIAGANAVDYTAHWANTQAAAVPEPTDLALIGVGMLGFVAARRRAKKSA